MKTKVLLSSLLLSSFAISGPAAVADTGPTPKADLGAAAQTLERGRYLTLTSGCNDCHTPGYPEADGNLSPEQWLTGSPVGFQGPWGTTYPANLRLLVQGLSEAQWLARVRQPMRPPMPWFNLRAMDDKDLIAIYRFIRALGPAGEPAPAAVGPDAVVSTPYIEFFPKNLHRQASR
jgi:mono/diheme cytochrome c family protein